MSNKKGGNNKKSKAMIIGVIMPFISTILIAACVFAIFAGILEIIMDVVDAILDFFQDPIGTCAEWITEIGNWVSSWARRRIYSTSTE